MVTRIFLVVPTLDRGGAERVVSLLSKGFSELGYEVFVIIFRGPVVYDISGTLINFNTVYSPKKLELVLSVLNLVRLLKKQIRLHKPDVVFSFMEIANFCAILAHPDSCASVRVSLGHLSRLSKLISKWLYPRAKKVIAVSALLAEELKRAYGLKNTCFIHNPIDFSHIDQNKDAPIVIEEDFILSVGRLTAQKNHRMLITAYATLVQKNNKKIPKLVIIGEGELRGTLQAQIDELGISEQVVLMGAVENPYAYMSRCQLFVLPSLYEGFPNVLIEAMACGALVLSTDCPTGPNEIIQHEKNGFLTSVESLEEMENRLAQCLLNEASSTEIRKAARESVMRFDLKAVSLQYLQQR